MNKEISGAGLAFICICAMTVAFCTTILSNKVAEKTKESPTNRLRREMKEMEQQS